MKKFFLHLLFFLTLPICLNAQVDEITAQEANISGYPRNSFYFEALGNGVIYSLNYDRILKQKGIRYCTFRTGFSFLPQIDDFTDYRLKSLIVEPGLMFETSTYIFVTTGIGAAYFRLSNVDEKANLLILSPGVGLRYQPDPGGVFFHIKWTPLIPFFAKESLDGFHYPDFRQLSIALGFSI
ncbi:MAG: hypothetical protein K9H64_06310 [Bacteroidales bacterium]|nr:hypothetical protein [Bacteroidales bacterium]MCF8455309.1 hypothetical protein [Bacteroidales bacterium]